MCYCLLQYTGRKRVPSLISNKYFVTYQLESVAKAKVKILELTEKKQKKNQTKSKSLMCTHQICMRFRD